LAQAGLGLWPVPVEAGHVPTISEFQEGLARFGYEVASTGVLDRRTQCALAAFQRHFRPARFDGSPDAETWSILQALLRSIR
jgi:N-acetyl-anhydromuramyl-L-alanine amidase AmpD